LGGTSQPSHGLHALWSVEIDLGGAEVGFSQVVRVSISPTDQRRKGGFPLPHGEFGLEVIALIGQWRFREHRSVPQMHRALQARGIRIARRSVTYLMQRYEELVTLHITDQERIKARLQKQGHVILAASWIATGKVCHSAAFF